MASDTGIQGMLNFLNTHFGMRLTRQDLESPSKDLLPNVVLAVYWDVGMNENAMDQPAFLKLISSTELITAAVYTVHLLQLMRSVFAGLGVPNVGIGDLQRPQPKRIRRLISVLLDNWTRQRSLLTRYDEKQQHRLAAKEETELLKNKVDVAKSRINELLVHPGCNAEQRALAEGNWKTKTEEHQAKQNTGLVKDKEYKDLKHELTKATCHLDAVTHTAQELSLAVREAHRAVAVSPTRLHREKEASTEELAQLRQEAAEEARKLTAVREQDEGRRRVSAACAEHSANLQARLRCLAALQDTSEELQRVHGDRVEAEAKYHRCLKILEDRQEELSNARARTATWRTAMQSKLESQRRQNKEIGKKRRETQEGEVHLREDLAVRQTALQQELARHEAAASEDVATAQRLVEENDAKILAALELRLKCEEVFQKKAVNIRMEAERELETFRKGSPT